MTIYPTRTAAHVALVGVLALGFGIAVRDPNIVAWGGALTVGIAFARAATRLSVMRIRNAGFEMLWPDARRVVRVVRGQTVVLRAEVRNRDTLAARYDKLRVVASPALECVIEPPAGEVKALGSVELTVKVRALRSGFHGIHGLALEVRGAPSLFEVPLTFANAFGIEAVPSLGSRTLAAPEGGRSRTTAVAGRSGRRRGDGSELRELRELVPGDSFRRIAWKASARRGKLMARELEREERDVVMLILDASTELWAGVIGDAPLDHAIDAVAGLADTHLACGDRVGLILLGSRELARVPSGSGRKQRDAVTRALLDHSGVLDADRSGWDEADMAVQVAEHLRPVDPRGLRDLRRGRFDRLAERASAARREAPFHRGAPAGRTQTDAELRRYAACFGLYGPPRFEPEREQTSTTLVVTLQELALEKRTRPSVVHVVAPPPGNASAEPLRAAIQLLRRKGVKVRWSAPPLASGLTGTSREAGGGAGGFESNAERLESDVSPEVYGTLRNAAQARARIAASKGEALLRSMGIKVSRSHRRPAMVEEP